MNSFSQLLESLVSEKNINITKMAAFCGIDRSSMYKIIHGTRKPPSADLVLEISHFMKLSPEESGALIKQYMILQIGADNFHRRKGIFSFLQECFSPPPSAQTVSFEKTFSCSAHKGETSSVFYGIGNILSAFGFMAQREMQRRNGRMLIRMQPDSRFIGLLATPGKCTGVEEGFRADHIMALSGIESTRGSTYNLEQIQTILAACKGFPFYHFYYYYTYVHTGWTLFSFLPGTVITEEYVLQISEDCQFAILHNQPETIAFFKKLFAQIRDSCMELTRIVRDYRDLLYNHKRRSPGKSPISCQMFPSLHYFVTEELLHKYLHPDLPNREFIIHASWDLSQRDLHLLRSSSVSVLVSETGIRRFLDTGLMPEYPSESYKPPDLPDRLYLMRRYLEAIQNHTVSFRIVRETFCNTSSQTSIWIEDSCACFSFVNEAEERKYMLLQDPDLLASLRDFLLQTEAEFYFDEARSLQILRDIIQEYAQD